MSRQLEVDHGDQKVLISLPKECFGSEGTVIENGNTQYTNIGIPASALESGEFESDFYYSEGNWVVTLEAPSDSPSFVEVSTYGKKPIRVTRRVYIDSKTGYSVTDAFVKENLDSSTCIDILRLVGFA